MGNQPAAPPDHSLIVAVDDNASDRALIEHILTKHGYTVQTTETAESALKIMQDVVPTVLVADVSLPGMSGIDLCSLLKKDDRLKNVPIVFLSGRDSPIDFQTGWQAGGVFYISKTGTMDGLLNVMRMLVVARS